MSWGLDDVTVRFGKKVALDGVSVKVESGVVTAVVGGDGAGKTTLARTMAGLLSATTGVVRRPDRIGYQPETSGVWSDLTVDENLELVAGAYGFSEEESARKMSDLLAATGLERARHRLGGRLSGGMRQKLGVAMALLAAPDLLVLDEPTTGLDPVSRLELWSFIAQAAEDGLAVLTTTAYVEEAERAGEIYVLDDGNSLASGSLDEVLSSTAGSIWEVDHGGQPLSWRRGPSWRVWSPDGRPPDGARPIAPDLQDTVTVAALRRKAAL